MSPRRANGAASEPRPKPWQCVMPVPEGAPEPGFSHPDHGKASATWAYRSDQGELLFYVARFQQDGGGKAILPRVYGREGTRSGWWWRHPPRPKALYRLDRLVQRLDAPVLVVEGEKTADAAAALLPDVVTVTWCGGSDAAEYADWSPLKGRRVTIWPDNDTPGRKAALVGGDALLDVAAEVWVVDPPADLPKGWDLADPLPEGLDPAELIAAAERHLPPEERLVEAAREDPGAAFEGDAVDFLAAMRARTAPATSVPAPASSRLASGSGGSMKRSRGGVAARPPTMAACPVVTARSACPTLSPGHTWSPVRRCSGISATTCAGSLSWAIIMLPSSRSGLSTRMSMTPPSTARASRS
jgi:putative DNA primase/helicase